MNVVIISRHPAAVEFVFHVTNLDPNDTLVVTGNATEQDVRGYVVYGNIPLHLAVLAKKVVAIEFLGDPPRGSEYTLADMIMAGAQLVGYRVQQEGYCLHCRRQVFTGCGEHNFCPFCHAENSANATPQHHGL